MYKENAEFISRYTTIGMYTESLSDTRQEVRHLVLGQQSINCRECEIRAERRLCSGAAITNNSFQCPPPPPPGCSGCGSRSPWRPSLASSPPPSCGAKPSWPPAGPHSGIQTFVWPAAAPAPPRSASQTSAASRLSAASTPACWTTSTTGTRS